MPSYEKLKWRCRRGMVELDILLLRYLETNYSQVDTEERSRFAELLGWEDDELLAVLLSGKTPQDRRFEALIGRIKRLAY